MTTPYDLPYELWDLLVPALPRRSRLYPVEPVGLGTAEVESLTSYMTRLAEAHCVPTGQLVQHEILPHFGRPCLPGSMTTFWSHYAPALNGVSSWTTDLVHLLQVLTGRSDLRFLTMLAWSEALSAYGLLRHQRAWCPRCLETWRQAGQVVYEPLLWSLAVVTICPWHRQRLQQYCPYCDQAMSWLEARTRPGFCSRCYTWLGEPTSAPIAQTVRVEVPELTWRAWVVLVVGELLALAPTLPAFPSQERVAQTLTWYIQQLGRGRQRRFCQVVQTHQVQLSAASLCRWQSGQVLPQLRTLLQLCYCLDTTPRHFLLADTLSTPATLVGVPFTEPHGQRTRQPARTLVDLRQAVATVLADEPEPPPSLTQVAKRLGYCSCIVLAKRLPEQSRAIAERYRLYRSTQTMQRRQRLQAEVRQVVFELHARGLYPRLSRVAALLNQPPSALTSAARTAWHQALRELNV